MASSHQLTLDSRSSMTARTWSRTSPRRTTSSFDAYDMNSNQPYRESLQADRRRHRDHARRRTASTTRSPTASCSRSSCSRAGPGPVPAADPAVQHGASNGQASIDRVHTKTIALSSLDEDKAPTPTRRDPRSGLAHAGPAGRGHRESAQFASTSADRPGLAARGGGEACRRAASRGMIRRSRSWLVIAQRSTRSSSCPPAATGSGEPGEERDVELGRVLIGRYPVVNAHCGFAAARAPSASAPIPSSPTTPPPTSRARRRRRSARGVDARPPSPPDRRRVGGARPRRRRARRIRGARRSTRRAATAPRAAGAGPCR